MAHENLKQRLIETTAIKVGPEDNLKDVLTKERLNEMATKLRSLKKELLELKSEIDCKDLEKEYFERYKRINAYMKIAGMDPNKEISDLKL